MTSEIQNQVRCFLQNKLEDIVRKNRNFSIRAMAKQLQVSPATLSRFMNKRTSISEKTLNKIVLKFEDEIALTKKANNEWQTEIKQEICYISETIENTSRLSGEPILVKNVVRMAPYRFDFFQEELKGIMKK